MKTQNLKYFGVTILSLWVTWRHRNVTIRLGEGTFLLVVNDDHASILHGYGDTGLQRFWGHEFDLLDSAYVVSSWWSIVTMHLFCPLWKFKVPKILGSRPWPSGGHVTSSVTWPSDFAWALSYWWSMMTMHLSCTDTEIRGFKDFMVTSLTF